MKARRSVFLGAAASALAVATALPASAHVTPTTYGTTYTAGATNVFYLRVPHACPDPDVVNSPGGTALTSKLVVDVPPAQVASVKPQFVPGWELSTVKDGTGAVTQITWEASSAAFALPDTSFMDFGIRATLRGAAGDKVLLPTHQHCDYHENGTPATGLVEEWTGPDTPTLTLVGADKAVNNPAHVADLKAQKAVVDSLVAGLAETRASLAELRTRVSAQVDFLVAVVRSLAGQRPMGDVVATRGARDRVAVTIDLSIAHRNRTAEILVNGSKVGTRTLDRLGDASGVVTAAAPAGSVIEVVVDGRLAAKSTF